MADDRQAFEGIKAAAILQPGDRVLVTLTGWPRRADIAHYKHLLAARFPDVEITVASGIESVTIQPASGGVVEQGGDGEWHTWLRESGHDLRNRPVEHRPAECGEAQCTSCPPAAVEPSPLTAEEATPDCVVPETVWAPGYSPAEKLASLHRQPHACDRPGCFVDHEEADRG